LGIGGETRVITEW